MQQTVDQILAGGHQSGPMTDIALVEMWLAECTTREGSTYALLLYISYCRWAEKRAATPIPIQLFGVALRLLNIERQRDRRGSLVSLAIKPNASRLQQTQNEKSRQRAGLRRLFRS